MIEINNYYFCYLTNFLKIKLIIKMKQYIVSIKSKKLRWSKRIHYKYESKLFDTDNLNICEYEPLSKLENLVDIL